MKQLELNEMEALLGGSPWWDNIAWTGVCGVVGIIVGAATLNPVAGGAASFVCSAIGSAADAAND